MATVIIDELIVKLGLDPSKFTKEQKDAEQALKKLGDQAEHTHKNLQKHTKDTAGMFSELRGQVLLLFAAFTAGKSLQQFIADAIASNLQLGMMARNMDTTIQTLAEWRIAGDVSGGTAAGITASLSSLNDQLQNIVLTGKSEIIPYFRAMDISLTDVNGRLKTSEELYRDIAHSPLFQSLDPARQAALLKGIGADPGMIRLIQMGGDALDRFLKAQKLYAPTNEDVEATTRLGRAWGEVKAASEAAGQTMFTIVSPALEKILIVAKRAIDYLLTHKSALIAVFTALGTAITALTVSLAVSAFEAFAGVFTGLGIALGPVTLIVLGLAAAGLLLYEYWEPLSAFFTDLGHRLATEFKPELDELHATLISAGDGFKYLWDAMGLGDGPFKNTEKGLRRINEAAEIVAASLKMAELSLRFIIDPFGAAKQIYTDYTAAKSSSGKGAPAASGIVGGTVGGAIRAFSSLFTAGEGGYNSVNLGQRFGYRSSIADLGGMTIDEVLAAQHAKQFNAAGHYQIIPSTLEGAKAALHLSGNEKFDKATQDRIFAQYLITTKQKDVGAYISGKSDNLKAALMGLAREWASFTDPDTGGSHYAGQHASVSLAKEIAVLNSLRAHNHKTYPTDKNPPEQQQGAGFMQTVHIGAITVNTQATDARGIADSLRSTLSYNDLAAQANGIGAVR